MSTATRGLGRRCLANGGGGECIGCGQCGAASNRSVDDLIGDVFDGMGAAFKLQFRTRSDGVAYLTALSRGGVGSVLSRRRAAPLVGRSLAAALSRLDAEWANPKTRAEFGGDKESFIAFRRHELGGDVAIAVDKRLR